MLLKILFCLRNRQNAHSQTLTFLTEKKHHHRRLHTACLLYFHDFTYLLTISYTTCNICVMHSKQESLYFDRDDNSE